MYLEYLEYLPRAEFSREKANCGWYCFLLFYPKRKRSWAEKTETRVETTELGRKEKRKEKKKEKKRKRKKRKRNKREKKEEEEEKKRSCEVRSFEFLVSS